MSKSREYWQGRFDQVEQAANNKSVKYTKQLEKKYQAAAKEIDGKINAWYQRIANNNGVSVADAKRFLDNSELKEFKWTVEEYIKYGQENAIDQRWMKELENASAKFHINRLEALKLECRQQVEQAFAGGQEAMYDTFADVYKDTFYHTCFEVQKGVGVGFDVSKLDNNQVSKLLNKPWSVNGTNFSENLWGNKTKLINTVDQELSRMILTGETPKNAIQNIQKAMNTSLYNAKRLVLTEQAYFTSLAQKDAFGELDVEEYEIVATLDGKTSKKCREEDGNHYPVKEMQPGINAPPFHVFCRSTTCPYFNDEWSVGERAARDGSGKTYYVPSDMTYEEWASKYVKSAPLKGIRTPVDIEFDTTVSGYKPMTGGHTVKSIGEKYGQEAKVVTLNKRNTIEWDELPVETQTQLKYTSMDGKQFHLAKGDYEVQRYVEGSIENIERDEIAKALDAEYIGFSFQRKNNQSFYVDFYQKGDELFCSIGKADVQKKLTNESLDILEKAMMERENLIMENIGESNWKNLSARQGDDWVASMKEFHRTIQADGKPSILPDAEYDAIQAPTLYRGIAPQSHLRKDITTTSTTKEMADEFFNGDSPFPSRGVYGDGVAYAAPAYKEIAWNYATGGGKQLHGGVIIEFKLKPDARIITYEDALDIFRQMSKKTNSKVLFNPNQTNAFNKEVGKAMNAMGYDAIIKHNGDNTGIDFYVILNRGALATKKKYITKAL